MIRLVVTGLLLAFNVVAAERPAIPAPGEDRELTKGQSAEEFFKARAADTACRGELAAAKAKYKESKKALLDLVAKKAETSEIDAQETKTTEAREAILGLMETCGECASRLERRNIPSPTHTEHWYIADGSCQLPADAAAKLEEAFAKGKSSLLHLKQYPKRTGGFEDVLEFVPVDQTTGKITDTDEVKASPFYAFIAIRGPEFIKGFPTALSYHFKNEYAETDEGFQLNFNAMKAPKDFKAPDVYIVSASGKKKTTRKMNLASVMGSWYINKKGYARYFTAADFPVDVAFAAALARKILLNTLVQFEERINPEGQ